MDHQIPETTYVAPILDVEAALHPPGRVRRTLVRLARRAFVRADEVFERLDEALERQEAALEPEVALHLIFEDETERDDWIEEHLGTEEGL